MSTAESTALHNAQLACPSCETVNAEATRYCSSCGSPLWQDCISCNASTRIGQRFCGGCGYNLAASAEEQLREATAWLEQAKEAFDGFDFEQTIAIAKRVIQRDDPRFAGLSDEAEQLFRQAQRASRQWQTKVEAARDAVAQAAEKHDFEGVIELLSPIPEPVLGETLARSLALARSQAASIGNLSLRLRRAIETKDLTTAGRLVDALLEIRPKHEEYAKLAIKIGHALLQSAERRFQKGLNGDALARLDATPEMARHAGEYRRLRSRIEDIEWLTDQMANTPFATPALARLAKRLTRLAPDGTHSPTLLSRLVTQLRSVPPDRYSLYSAWTDEPRGWADAPILLLSRPQQFGGSEATVLKKHPTRFAIAIGLALQGIGLASFEGQLSSAPPKSGLRRLLRRPSRTDAAWGIDAGASAIRAVRLERTSDGPRITDACMVPFEQPLCRATATVDPSASLQQALQELATKIMACGEEPVWANLAARETLGRFIALPPAPEKTLTKIVDQEMVSGFPVAVDELRLAQTITKPAADGTRRAVMVAARRERVEQREKIFEQAGIKLSGLQADPLALHNFVHHELKERLVSRPATGATPEAIVLLDGGASGVTFYMATSEVFWFRFVDGGGEDLTARLATACAATPRDAELLKADPAALPTLRPAMNAVESQMQHSARRLDQHYTSAAKFLGEIRLKQIYCTGGAPLMHGWVRHVLQGRRTV